MPTSLIQSLRIDAAELPSDAVLFGSSPGMREVRNQVERVLDTGLPVLIRGERGTGKETLARFLHAHSDRRGAPFVKVSCARMPHTQLESELLGLEPRGFGGIDSARRGLAEIAAGGTLFFDEIGEMDWAAQSRLLNLLEQIRCGSPGPDSEQGAQAGARVICATSSNLEKAVARRAFREDLFYRIDVIHLHLKPLRERRQDIPRLCEHLIEKLSRKLGKSVEPLTPEALEMLKQRSWPGNLRELENWITRKIVLGSNHGADDNDLRRAAGARETGDRVEVGATARTEEQAGGQADFSPSRATILRTLRSHGGNRRRAALALGIGYRCLLSRLKRSPVRHLRQRLRSKPDG